MHTRHITMVCRCHRMRVRLHGKHGTALAQKRRHVRVRQRRCGAREVRATAPRSGRRAWRRSMGGAPLAPRDGSDAALLCRSQRGRAGGSSAGSFVTNDHRARCRPLQPYQRATRSRVTHLVHSERESDCACGKLHALICRGNRVARRFHTPRRGLAIQPRPRAFSTAGRATGDGGAPPRTLAVSGGA